MAKNEYVVTRHHSARTGQAIRIKDLEEPYRQQLLDYDNVVAARDEYKKRCERIALQCADVQIERDELALENKHLKEDPHGT